MSDIVITLHEYETRILLAALEAMRAHMKKTADKSDHAGVRDALEQAARETSDLMFKIKQLSTSYE